MAFSESIHYVEIALRNKIDRAIGDWFTTQGWPTPGNETTTWLDIRACAPLSSPAEFTGVNRRARNLVVGATARAAERRSAVTHGHVVAELSLGWWQTVLQSNRIWSNCLARGVFSASARRERPISSINDNRELCNRIAHHEPIFDSPLTSGVHEPDHDGGVRGAESRMVDRFRQPRRAGPPWT